MNKDTSFIKWSCYKLLYANYLLPWQHNLGLEKKWIFLWCDIFTSPVLSIENYFCNNSKNNDLLDALYQSSVFLGEKKMTTYFLQNVCILIMIPFFLVLQLISLSLSLTERYFSKLTFVWNDSYSLTKLCGWNKSNKICKVIGKVMITKLDNKSLIQMISQ